MEIRELIKNRIHDHLYIMQMIIKDDNIINNIMIISNVIIECFKNGGKVYFCGNGGSAADAQHLAAEFSGKFYIDRAVLPSEALHCNTSYLTAVANDYSYNIIYARLISGLGKKGDILVGISTSGNSDNIIQAFNVCKDKEIKSIAFVGNKGGVMGKIANYSLIVPSSDTPRIQEMHITMGHIICEIVEAAIFKKIEV